MSWPWEERGPTYYRFELPRHRSGVNSLRGAFLRAFMASDRVTA